MPEKVSPASAFLPVINYPNPTSAFRHQGQPSTAGHGLVRSCPAIQTSPRCRIRIRMQSISLTTRHIKYIANLIKKAPALMLFQSIKQPNRSPLSNALSSLSLITLLLGPGKIYLLVQLAKE